MLDLSPEKLLVLLAVGLVVLGPDKLPGAARTVARGLTQARHLARELTDPVRTTMVEPLGTAMAAPRQVVEEAVTGLHQAIQVHSVHGDAGSGGIQPPVADPSLN